MIPRDDRTRDEIAGLFDRPFGEQLFHAAIVHREYRPPMPAQLCTLLAKLGLTALQGAEPARACKTAVAAE